MAGVERLVTGIGLDESGICRYWLTERRTTPFVTGVRVNGDGTGDCDTGGVDRHVIGDGVDGNWVSGYGLSEPGTYCVGGRTTRVGLYRVGAEVLLDLCCPVEPHAFVQHRVERGRACIR
jgi:hypothetical protein